MRADLEFGTIAKLVRQNATRFADLEAVVDNEKRLTYPQLNEAVRGAARSYIACGIQKGDRVSIWAPNIWEWVIAALGAVTVGGVLVPLNTRFKGEEAAYILSRSRARMLLCVNGFLGNDYVTWLRGADTPTPSIERIVVMRGDAPDGTIDWQQFLALGKDVADSEVDARIDALSPDDLSDIFFTSGTTGRPKGVMTNHAQNIRVFDDWSQTVGVIRGDRFLIVNPFFHTFGYKGGILGCLIRGATIIPEVVFDVPTALRRISAEKVSMLPGPPTLFLSILNHPERDKFDLSSLRLAVTGAAAVPVEMLRRMREELTFQTIITAYGLTESCGTISMCRPEDDYETISLTSGRALIDVEVKIIDDAFNEVPRGEAGEIVCRGYNVMQGYFEDEAATAEAITADGWLHTGDIGTMNDRGYINITDRKKDLFIVGGFNAYPAEIENYLLSHPDIAQVAVIGVPDERQGEVGWAFVTARPGSTIDPEEVVTWSRERMANYKVPRRVVVLEALPTNPNGKVTKFELRDLAVKLSQ
ncbi:MAG: AMP-binding protein [Actinobacteria bacterium]|nr:AMP-binding protein [Actinomycetota bacterium]